jgi:ADP-ribose pyrophosphatase YjhB (NUDIX family)
MGRTVNTLKLRTVAGGVVVGPQNKIVVVNQHGDSWSLPKGHAKDGEDAKQAAVREIQEETGISSVQVIDILGTYSRSRIGKNGVGEVADDIRHITMFLCVTSQQDLQPIDPENPIAEWLSVHKVADRLTHPKDKEFFHKITPKILKFLAS